MISTERIGAFVEYVARPLIEDIRLILEKTKELNLPINEGLILKVGKGLVVTQIVGELIRALSYIVITWILCKTVLLSLN